MQEPRRAKDRSRWLLSLLVLLILSAGFAAIDLGVKSVIYNRFGNEEPRIGPPPREATVIPGVLFLQIAHNTGGLFGIGPGHRSVFILLSSLTMAFVLWMYLSFGMRQWMTKIALGLILGGAIGNLVDRIHYAYVRDFLLIRVGRFHWPNFNVADVWICVGAAMLILWMISHPEPKQAAREAAKR
jgi:signal peptidase II